jgi:site-specific DNA-methyltransferase (adenine-specific)
MAALIRLFGAFDLDACATAATAKAPSWFGADSPTAPDGLVLPWWGRTFVNPPYGTISTRRWLEKCHHEALSGHAEVVALIAARTDTVAWHAHVMQATHVLLLRGRLTFVGAANSAPFPSAVVNWRPGMLGNPRFNGLEV